jgi:hypothetical protein
MADRDSRTYIRVHDGMDEHPKIEGLSDAAFRTFFRGLFYSSRQRTDGLLTDAAWRNRGSARSRRELVDAGLAHPPGYECPHPECPTPPRGHVQLHDYLDWQRSAAEIAALTQKRSESGRKGGKARATRQASAKQTPGQTGSKVEAESETDTETSLRSVGTRVRGTRLTDDFTVTDEMRSWAHDQGYADRWIDAATASFADYWRAQPGQRGVKTDWPATWRNWLRREAERGRPLAAAGAGAGSSTRPAWDF